MTMPQLYNLLSSVNILGKINAVPLVPLVPKVLVLFQSPVPQVMMSTCCSRHKTSLPNISKKANLLLLVTEVVYTRNYSCYVDDVNIAILPRERFLNVVPGEENPKPPIVNHMASVKWLRPLNNSPTMSKLPMMRNEWAGFYKFQAQATQLTWYCLRSGIALIWKPCYYLHHPSKKWQTFQLTSSCAEWWPRKLRKVIYDQEFKDAVERVAGPSFVIWQSQTETGDGVADYAIIGRQWVIELMVEGSNLKDHIARFQPTGRYYSEWVTRKNWQWDWWIVDFCFHTSQVKKNDCKNFHTITLEMEDAESRSGNPIFMNATITGAACRVRHVNTFSSLASIPPPPSSSTSTLRHKLPAMMNLVEGFEDSGFIDDSPRPSSPILTSSFSIPPLSTTPNKGLDTLLTRIGDCYVTQQLLGEVDEEQEDGVLGQKGLWLREGDWPLWQVKCTLISKHKVLRDELQCRFYNPRDVSYVYFKAQFSKSGPQLLREVLRGLYNTKMSTLALIPESELNNCLHMQDDRGFAPGQWVQIRRGLYRGDVGLVHESYHDNDSTRGVKVLLFSELKKRAGKDLFEIATMPLPSFWHFSLGEKVLIHYKEGVTFGTVLTLEEEGDMEKSWCIVDVVMVRYLEKSIIPGNFVKVLQGAHIGKSGFVVAKIDDHLGICIGARTTGIDFRVHVNSVKLATPRGNVVPVMQCGMAAATACIPMLDGFCHSRLGLASANPNPNSSLWSYVDQVRGQYLLQQNPSNIGMQAVAAATYITILVQHRVTPNYLNMEIPWLNVEVKLLFQPHAGQTGWVKDVFVDLNRSLRLAIYLSDRKTCTVGHSEVLECWTGKLLLDYQPLKPHQHQFDVEVPWRDVEVIIQSGSFVMMFDEISEAHCVSHYGCPDIIAQLKLITWLSWNAGGTCKPLLEYLPLQEHQLERFSLSSSFEVMQTGPVPWVGFLVDFVKGEYKLQQGVIRNVNRYTVDPLKPKRQSRLTLTVECYTFSGNSSNQLVKVDYNAVRYHRTNHLLCDIFMPTAKQSFYIPNTIYDQRLPETPEKLALSESSMSVVSTPMPNYFKKETIFTGIWAPGYVYLDPLESPLSPDPVRASESPPPPDPRCTSPPLPEQPLQHWILHPKLLGIPIQVDINGGELDTSMKKGRIFVKTINSVNGISVIHHFYKNEKTNENHMLVAFTIDHSGPLETPEYDRLDVYPLDLEYVQETAKECKYSKTLLEFERADMSLNTICLNQGYTISAMQSSLSNLDPDASSNWTLGTESLEVLTLWHQGTTAKGPSIPPEPATASPSSDPSMNTPLKLRPGGRTGNLSKKSIFPLYVPVSPTPEGSLQPSSSLSPVINAMNSLHLEDLPMPGAFTLNDNLQSASKSSMIMSRFLYRCKSNFTEAPLENTPTALELTINSLETLLTAATLTAKPLDTSTHNKLFTSSAEFYHHTTATLPNTIENLDISSAAQGLQAVAQAKRPSFTAANRIGHQFEADELKTLKKIEKGCDEHHAQIFDCDFASLSTNSKCGRLDDATAFLCEALRQIHGFDSRSKRRTKGAADPVKDRREQMRTCIRTIYDEICVLYAPLIPECPIEIAAV
ncbi:hypothetical protein BT96DRAFT_1093799 [Gymnopus androsaceus JB14]|uniref:KOW domain-containing protein n=1 Tax=Gymnopus androsaceus JB14 TaxID=1447944 RepID=A0A6A4GHU2_9AGAR|nr:hypothetical protein BT96DRAFT_1093799 [Gymnopus androsaceus JB14]